MFPETTIIFFRPAEPKYVKVSTAKFLYQRRSTIIIMRAWCVASDRLTENGGPEKEQYAENT